MQQRVAGSQLPELNDREWLWQRCQEEADDGRIAAGLGVTAEVVRKARRSLGIRREKGKPVSLDPDWVPRRPRPIQHVTQHDPALRQVSAMAHCQRCRWCGSPLIVVFASNESVEVIDRKIARDGERLVHVGCGGAIVLYLGGKRWL